MKGTTDKSRGSREKTFISWSVHSGRDDRRREGGGSWKRILVPWPCEASVFSSRSGCPTAASEFSRNGTGLFGAASETILREEPT